MRKTKKLVRETAARYIAEIQKRLPRVAAIYDPEEEYDTFDGIIRVTGPYDHVDDEEKIAQVDYLAMEINERYGIDFLVLYEQEEPAHSQA